jgi:hypothetical protein
MAQYDIKEGERRKEGKGVLIDNMSQYNLHVNDLKMA